MITCLFLPKISTTADIKTFTNYIENGTFSLSDFSINTLKNQYAQSHQIYSSIDNLHGLFLLTVLNTSNNQNTVDLNPCLIDIFKKYEFFKIPSIAAGKTISTIVDETKCILFNGDYTGNQQTDPILDKTDENLLVIFYPIAGKLFKKQPSGEYKEVSGTGCAVGDIIYNENIFVSSGRLKKENGVLKEITYLSTWTDLNEHSNGQTDYLSGYISDQLGGIAVSEISKLSLTDFRLDNTLPERTWGRFEEK